MYLLIIGMPQLQKETTLAKSLQIKTPKTTRSQRTTEAKMTKQNDTDKMRNGIGKTKHVTDRRSHFTMRRRIDGKEEKLSPTPRYESEFYH